MSASCLYVNAYFVGMSSLSINCERPGSWLCSDFLEPIALKRRWLQQVRFWSTSWGKQFSSLRCFLSAEITQVLVHLGVVCTIQRASSYSSLVATLSVSFLLRSLMLYSLFFTNSVKGSETTTHVCRVLSKTSVDGLPTSSPVFEAPWSH